MAKGGKSKSTPTAKAKTRHATPGRGAQSGLGSSVRKQPPVNDKSRRKRSSKRGATIRAGFDYQDLVAARSVLAMLQPEGPIAVCLEASKAGTVDDVIECLPQHSIYKQVKWSASPLGDPYTLRGLATVGRGRKVSLIGAMGRSWRDISGGGAVTVELVSNRHPDEELRELLHDEPAQLRWPLRAAVAERLDRLWRKHTQLRPAEFTAFLQALRFRLDHGSREELKSELTRILNQLGVGPDGIETLLRAVKAWATDASIESVSRRDVEAVLGIHGATPDNRFKIDAAILVQRTTVHAALAPMVEANPGRYVVVLGAAGTGKSTMLNSIGPGSQLAKRHDVLVYNCFTGPGDSSQQTRARASNLAQFLVDEMHRLCPGQWRRRCADGDDLEEVLNEAAKCLGKRRFVLVIDGLDYARQNEPGPNGLWSRLPPALPANLTMLVSAQSRDQLPRRLQSLPPGSYFDVPALTPGQSRELLRKLGVFKAWGAMHAFDEQAIGSAVYTKARGHPLCTVYTGRWLVRSSGKPQDLVCHLETLEDFDGDVARWYERLPTLASAYGRALLGAMAACPYALSAKEADAFLGHGQSNPYAAEDALRSVSYLFREHDGQWHFVHDSLRAFSTRTATTSVGPREFLDHLRELPNDPRTGEHLGELCVATGEHDWAAAHLTPDWLASQYANGARPSLVRRGYELLLAHAVKRRDWPHAAKWALDLQRLEGELSHVIEWRQVQRTWLACGRNTLVLRAITDGDRLFVPTVRAFDAASALAAEGHSEDAASVTRLAASTPLDVSDYSSPRDWSDEVIPHVRHLAKAVSVDDCCAEIRRLAKHARSSTLTASSKDSVLQHERELAAHAAFALLGDEDFDKVEEWLTQQAIPLDKSYRCLLRATLDLRHPAAKGKSRAVVEALKDNPPLWFIRAARLQPRYTVMACKALAARPLPSDLLRPQWMDNRGAFYQAAVRDVVDDVMESFAAKLPDREQRLQDQTGENVRPIGTMLYKAAFRIGRALATKSDWEAAANELIEVIRGWNVVPMATYEHSDLGCGLQELVLSIGARAGRPGLPSLADWLQTGLLPLLNQKWLASFGVRVPLSLGLLAKLIPESAKAELFAREEEALAGSHADQCSAYLELAALAGECDRRADAERFLTKGIRCGFSYGYRKDATILVFHNGLAAVGQALGARFLEHVARGAAALEALNELTDHKGLNHAGTDLAAAIACTDVELAARVSARLRVRLKGYLFQGDLGQMLRERGVDVDAARSAFEHRGEPVYGEISEAPRRINGAIADLNKLVADYRSVSKDDYSGRSRIGERIIKLVNNCGDFKKAKELFESGADVDYSLQIRLARAAQQLGLRQEAVGLAADLVKKWLSEDRWYWSWGVDERIAMLVKLQPDRAEDFLFEMADRGVRSNPQFLGYFFVNAIIQMLAKVGRVADAAVVFEVLAGHVDSILEPYPSTRGDWIEWMKASADPTERVNH